MIPVAARGGLSLDERAMLWACMQEVCNDLLRSEASLSALDRAIGDGDHGANLARGARAILAAEAELRAQPAAQALENAGTLVVTHVGGASGPLYGSLLLAMARSWPSDTSATLIAAALADGVAAVGRRGRSTVGEKTILDVLIPASEAFRATADSRTPADAIAAMLTAADAGLEATRALRASKGRAAYVGERSIGHYDPGAASARLCLHAIARVALHNHAPAGST
jgi:phosphoenolpyruvate---glycerone phosphotransferase subunit DhaL